MKTPRSLLIVSFAALLLAGCKVELYSGLSQRDANEIAAALMEANISTERAAAKGGYAIRIDEARFAEAVKILSDRGLPRETFKEFDQIFAGDSFIPTPTEERARLVYAKSQELSRTVSEIDGVVAARVHLVLPERDPLARETRPASASVAIHHRPGLDVSALTPRVKMLVANSVEGLEYERVSIAFFPTGGPRSEAATGAGAAAPAEPRRAMSAVLLIGAALLGALALTLQTGGRRKAAEAPAARAGRK